MPRRSNGLWEAIAVAKIEWKEVLAEQVLRTLLSPYTAHHRTASKPHAPHRSTFVGLAAFSIFHIQVIHRFHIIFPFHVASGTK